MSILAQLSIIVPVGLDDPAWPGLAADLVSLSPECEVIWVTVDPTGLQERMPRPDRINFRFVRSSSPARAHQLNAGARAACGQYLWFVHADSRLSRTNLSALTRSITSFPSSMHYFNLEFLADGPAGVRLNAWGAWFRSHILGLPFGDQGFCLHASDFHDLGGFRTDVPYGEDHLLIWQASERQIPLQCTGDALRTSARRYREHGWLKTTTKHLALTMKQALAQWWRLKRRRVGLL